MPVSLPYRIGHRSKLVAQEVSDCFQALKTAINGQLKADAFAPWARLKNANKVDQYGLFALQFRFLSINAGVTRRIYLPIPGQGSRVLGGGLDIRIVRWSMYAQGATGTVTLYRNDSTGNPAIVTGPRAVADFNDAVASSPAGNYDSRIGVELAKATGAVAQTLVVTVWCKVKHVR